MKKLVLISMSCLLAVLVACSGSSPLNPSEETKTTTDPFPDFSGGYVITLTADEGSESFKIEVSHDSEDPSQITINMYFCDDEFLATLTGTVDRNGDFSVTGSYYGYIEINLSGNLEDMSGTGSFVYVGYYNIPFDWYEDPDGCDVVYY